MPIYSLKVTIDDGRHILFASQRRLEEMRPGSLSRAINRTLREFNLLFLSGLRFVYGGSDDGKSCMQRGLQDQRE